MFSSEPPVARGRAMDRRAEVSMRARRCLVGTQQGGRLGGIQLAAAACAAGTRWIWARERNSATPRR